MSKQSPEKLYSFIESYVFQPAWRACGLSDPDLWELQDVIMTNPKGHPVMKGTGGLRKVRFSPAKSKRGKSGSHRVCYAYFEEFGIILLVTAYPKNKKDNLSDAACRAVQKLIERHRRSLG
jgi:hypothetical protein